MNPHSIDFTKSPLSPIHTPKRRILGELQNFKPLGDIQNYNQQNFKPSSPYIDRLKHSPLLDCNSSKHTSQNSKENLPHTSNYIPNLKNSPVFTSKTNLQKTPKSPIFGIKNKSPNLSSFGTQNLTPGLNTKENITSIKSPLLNSPIISTHSPLTRKVKRTSKITRIFEERTKFKMDNKENISETFMKFDFEEETRDCSFSGGFEKKTWTSAKLDFTDTLPQKHDPYTVPQTDSDIDDMSLQDLEAEFDNEQFDTCTKYEIISTDSPDIISRGRSSNQKITSRSFNFGAPISDSEASTSFNEASTSEHTYKATRMLNFDDEDFEFTSPAVKKSVSVKKSLKFNETPTKTLKVTETSKSLKFTESSIRSLKFTETKSLQFTETSKSMKYTETIAKYNQTPTKLCHQKSDSSIGSMPSPASSLHSYKAGSSLHSPASSQPMKLYTSESTASMESGFISELEEPFLDIEDSNSPKVANFSDLLSGQIKDNIFTDKEFKKRPTLARSLSFHPESKAKVSLLSILESPEEKRGSKRMESEEADTEEDENRVKRRKQCGDSETRKPVLQRAMSENNASIMTALARSAMEPDLIGDFSSSFSLPLTPGDHSDLKSITCDTLARLLRGEYKDTVSNYQIIDCRYPYEYRGGHIETAINLYTHEQILKLVKEPQHQNSVLILHCEFSIERGPKLFRYLRSVDRSLNVGRYPRLHYPEMYVLCGGYRAFHRAHPALCAPPGGYTPMTHPTHRDALRRHRAHAHAQKKY